MEKPENASDACWNELNDKFNNYKIIPTGGAGISGAHNNALVSFTFCYCSGIALKGEKVYGLAHILPRYNPDACLDWMIKGMDVKNGLKAIISIGAKEDRKEIEQSCKKHSIEIVDSFQTKKMPNIDRYDYRDILVVPNTGEVIIHTTSSSQKSCWMPIYTRFSKKFN